MSSIFLSSFIRTSSYWSKQAGIRWQLILSVGAVALATVWLQREYGQDDSSLWLVMNLLMRFVQWMLTGLVVVGVVSALTTWAFFLQSTRNKKLSIHIRIGDGQKAEAGLVTVAISITGRVFRPLLGTIQSRLVFSEKRMSDRIILDTNVSKPRHFWRHGIKGSGSTRLHDRGIYDVESVLVTFSDMLALVSLPCTVPLTQQLYTLPRTQKESTINAQPNSTEEQKHRIEVPKRVEGELVNYKEFETGDNIQRIVWKIYAKSGQLVVRVPEIKDPYASHLYFYVSYFHGFEFQGGAFEMELLNVYKDHVRNLLEAVQRNGYDVRMPQDQEVPKLAGVGDKKNELFQITAASWQKGNSPIAFVNVGKAAFVCLPSLVPAGEVAPLLRNLPASVPLVVVKLSGAIPSPFRFGFKDIFFAPEQQPADKLKSPWLMSSLRRSLLKNEKELAALFRQRDNCWLTNTLDID